MIAAICRGSGMILGWTFVPDEARSQGQNAVSYDFGAPVNAYVLTPGGALDCRFFRLTGVCTRYLFLGVLA